MGVSEDSEAIRPCIHGAQWNREEPFGGPAWNAWERLARQPRSGSFF